MEGDAFLFVAFSIDIWVVLELLIGKHLYLSRIVFTHVSSSVLRFHTAHPHVVKVDVCSARLPKALYSVHQFDGVSKELAPATFVRLAWSSVGYRDR